MSQIAEPYVPLYRANHYRVHEVKKSWQRQLTDNAIYAAGRIDFIRPTDGRSIRDIQPKAPSKATPVR